MVVSQNSQNGPLCHLQTECKGVPKPPPVLQGNYTREHSEATQALLQGFVGDIVEGVASSRGLPEAEVSLSSLRGTKVADAVLRGDGRMRCAHQSCVQHHSLVNSLGQDTNLA